MFFFDKSILVYLKKPYRIADGHFVTFEMILFLSIMIFIPTLLHTFLKSEYYSSKNFFNWSNTEIYTDILNI